jgi:hypothetical protein
MADFFSFWYRGKLTPIEQLCLTSFISKGHSVDLYSYYNVDVPTGVVLRDASSIIPEKNVFFYKRGPGSGSVAAFSNIFRYKVLYERGGWWTDTDVICLSEDVPSDPICFAYEDANCINGALLKIPARHEFAEVLLREACLMGDDFQWGACGPKLITQTVNSLSLHRYALPASDFYPVHYNNAGALLLPDRLNEVRDLTSHSYFVHLWNEVFRRAGVLKTAAPPVGSYLWEKMLELEIDFSGLTQYSDDQIRRLLHLNELEERYAELSEKLEETSGRLSKKLEETSARYRRTKTDLRARHRRSVSDLRRRLKERDKQVAQIRESASWRLTRPFRAISRLLKFQSLRRNV